jgi:hypothetical protein
VAERVEVAFALARHLWRIQHKPVEARELRASEAKRLWQDRHSGPEPTQFR